MARDSIVGIEAPCMKIVEADGNMLRKLTYETVKVIIKAVADRSCQTVCECLSEARVNSRNDYRERAPDTRVGELDVP